MFEQRGDHPVDQLAQQPRRLQAGELLLLERVLHMGLDAGEVAPEGAQRRVARDRALPGGQRRERVGQERGGGLGGLRQGGGHQHRSDRTYVPVAAETGSSAFRRYSASSASRGVSGRGPIRPSRRATDRSRRLPVRGSSGPAAGEQRQRAERRAGSPAGRHVFPATQAATRRGAPPAPARRRAPRRARPSDRPAAPSATSCRKTTVPFHSFTRMVCGAQPRQPIRQFGKLVEMCGENGAAADRRVQRLQHRPGDRQAVERRGAAADLVHHHQRARAGLVQDRGGLGHFDHEGGAPARQVVRRRRRGRTAGPPRRCAPTPPAPAGRPAPARRSARSAAERSTCRPCSGRSAAARAARATGRSGSARRRRGRPAPASTTGWRPARIWNSSSSVTTGRHQVPDSASFAADCADVEQGQRVGAGGERLGVVQRAAHQMGEHRAFARGGALGGLGDAPVEVGQLRRGEARAVGHALAQRQFREGRAAFRPPRPGASMT